MWLTLFCNLSSAGVASLCSGVCKLRQLHFQDGSLTRLASWCWLLPGSSAKAEGQRPHPWGTPCSGWPTSWQPAERKAAEAASHVRAWLPLPPTDYAITELVQMKEQRDSPPLHGVSDKEIVAMFNLLLHILRPYIKWGQRKPESSFILRQNNAGLGASQCAGLRPSASPKNSLEIQILRSHPRLAEWESLFYINMEDILPLMLNFAEPIVQVENQFRGGKQLCLLRRQNNKGSWRSGLTWSLKQDKMFTYDLTF